MGATVELIGFGEKDRLWRWDTNRQIRIIPETGATIDEIRFSNIFSETPLKVEPKTNEHGDIVADIPNILLQDIFPIDVQVIMFFNNGKQTIYNTSYKVENRKKPPEYVYTETEIKNYDDLEKRITDLEKGGTGGGNGEPGADGYSPEAKVKETEDGAKITITDKNGTTEATVKNGKDGKDGVDGKTAYEYAKDGGYTGTEEEFAQKMAEENPTKEEFDKLSEEIADLKENGVGGGTGESVTIPTALPNPYPLTFTGAVTGSYDGSQAVNIEVPAGGSGGGVLTPAEVVLASGTLTAETESNTKLYTGITLADLRRYKSFIILVKGAANTSLTNLIFQFSTSNYAKYIFRTSGAGVCALYEWADAEKTILNAYVTTGNPSMIDSVNDAIIETKIRNPDTESLWFPRRCAKSFSTTSLAESEKLYLFNPNKPTIDYAWAIKGVFM